MEQINYAVPRTNPAHGARQQAVADATQAIDPRPAREPPGSDQWPIGRPDDGRSLLGPVLDRL